MRISRIARRAGFVLVLASAVLMGSGADVASAAPTPVGQGVVTGRVGLPPGATAIECGPPVNDYTFTGFAIAGAITDGADAYAGTIPITNPTGGTRPIASPDDSDLPWDGSPLPAVPPVLCPDNTSNIFSGMGTVGGAFNGRFISDGGQVGVGTGSLALSGEFIRLGSVVIVDLEGCARVGVPAGSCNTSFSNNADVLVVANIQPDPLDLCTDPPVAPVTVACGAGAGELPIGAGDYILAGSFTVMGKDVGDVLETQI